MDLTTSSEPGYVHSKSARLVLRDVLPNVFGQRLVHEGPVADAPTPRLLAELVEHVWVHANLPTDRHRHPWQVLRQDGRAHELPRALDGRRMWRRRRRIDDRWHVLRLCEQRRGHRDRMRQKCRERRHEKADGQRGARGASRSGA